MQASYRGELTLTGWGKGGKGKENLLPNPNPSPYFWPSLTPLKQISFSLQLASAIKIRDGGRHCRWENTEHSLAKVSPALRARSIAIEIDQVRWLSDVNGPQSEVRFPFEQKKFTWALDTFLWVARVVTILTAGTSDRGYSPDSHVDLDALFYVIWPKEAYEGSPPPSYALE